MTYETIEVRKINPVIGAEIRGVNLEKSPTTEQLDEIFKAWMENLVIFFRNQNWTIHQHLDFGRRFGELHIHPAAGREDYPELLMVTADENSARVAGEEWHTDVSCDAEPPMGSLLYLTEVPPDGGGDTLFANMYQAYEALSDPIKDFLCGLSAVHDGKAVFNGPGYRVDGVSPVSEHPIVRTHPVTGRQALYVNRLFTTHIVGLNRNESDDILQMLYRHIETPDFSVRLHWQPNTLVCWDNRCTQHRAIWDYFPSRRSGRRVTIKGEKPFHRESKTDSATRGVATLRPKPIRQRLVE